MNNSKKLSEEVQNYEFTDFNDKKTSLMELFGEKNDLILIHNMGSSCAYCTMWADGFNGILPHLKNRASFVISSPDDSKTQKKFAITRGWNFQMISTKGTSFTKDMGFEKDGIPQPGVSVFFKDGNKIIRVGRDDFEPGDNYCATFPLFDLLKDGTGNWQAKFQY